MALLDDVRVVMLLYLAVATAFAIAHDRFYNGLDGLDVSLYDQRFSTNIGTVFAFIIKAALALANTAVYTQILWYLFARSTQTVAGVNALTGLVSSPFELRRIKVYKHPLLAALALIVWFMPLAAVVPPGALSVKLDYRTLSNNTPIYFHNFSTETIASKSGTWLTETSNINSYAIHIEPRTKAANLAIYVSWTSSIPPVAAAANVSYTLSFIGPTLDCSSKRWYAADRLVCYDANKTVINYLSWVGGSGSGGTGYFGLPKNLIGQTKNDTNVLTECGVSKFYSSFSGNDTVLYIAARTTDYNLTTTWNVTTCHLRNSTYKVTYSSYDTEEMGVDLQPEIMYGMHQSWAAQIWNETKASVSYSASLPVPDHYRWAFYETTSFYAIFTVMAQLAVGIQTGWAPGSDLPIPLLESRAGLTEELYNLTELVLAFDSEALFKVSDSLATVLEQMMQNITIASMTSPLLTAQKMIPANVTVPINIYSYNSQHLWLSYGIGLGMTALIIAGGIWTVARNDGAGYSSKFSTYYRAIQHQSAAEPLPQAIARTEIRLGLQKDYMPVTTLDKRTDVEDNSQEEHAHEEDAQEEDARKEDVHEEYAREEERNSNDRQRKSGNVSTVPNDD